MLKEWMLRNYLFPNTNKTKVMICDILPCYQYKVEVYIQNFRFIAECKYLGVINR